jgi:cytochrome c
MYGIDSRRIRTGTAKSVLVPAVWLLVAGLAAPAAASEELARDKRCLGCHAVDAMRVGPAFQAVARRYAAQPGAAPMLARKIIEGGAGNWGPVPMTANSQVSEAQARQLVTWILSLK